MCLLVKLTEITFPPQESPHPPRLQQAANGRAGCPALETIGERSTMESCDLYDPYGESVSVHGDMDFLQAELVRSKFPAALPLECLSPWFLLDTS